MNNTENFEMNKKEFLKLYEKAKKNQIDLHTLPEETLKKMCTLLEEEIKMKQRDVEILRAKLNVC